jgi:hypothetical protein
VSQLIKFVYTMIYSWNIAKVGVKHQSINHNFKHQFSFNIFYQKQSCIFVLEVLILTFSTILIFDFGIVSTVWCFFAFHFIWSLFINMAIKFWFQYKFNSTSRILFFCFCTIYLKKNNCNDRSQNCIIFIFVISDKIC